MGEASDETGSDRVRNVCHYDRYDTGRFRDGPDRSRSSPDDNEINFQADQLSGQLKVAFLMALSISVFDDYILPLHIARSRRPCRNASMYTDGYSGPRKKPIWGIFFVDCAWARWTEARMKAVSMISGILCRIALLLPVTVISPSGRGNLTQAIIKRGSSLGFPIWQTVRA